MPIEQMSLVEGEVYSPSSTQRVTNRALSTGHIVYRIKDYGRIFVVNIDSNKGRSYKELPALTGKPLFPILSICTVASKTTGNFHVWVALEKPHTRKDRCFLSLLMGSDPVRELILMDKRNPWYTYETQYSDEIIDQWLDRYDLHSEVELVQQT